MHQTGNFTSYLNGLSPSDVVKDEALRHCFRSFLSRGTEEEWKQLIPDKPRKNKQPKRKTERIPVAITTIEKCEVLPDTAFDNAWVATGTAFDSRNVNVYGRIARLANCVEQLEHRQLLLACMSRMGLLFFSHELERLEHDIAQGPATLSRGRGLRTITYELIHDECGIDIERLKELSRRSNVYLTIVQSGGLGSLLSIGTIQNTWEKLNQDKILQVFERVQDNPGLRDKLRKLDPVAARMAVQGLHAYGWEYTELSKGGSKLMDIVGKHVNLGQLHKGKIVLYPAEPSSQLGNAYSPNFVPEHQPSCDVQIAPLQKRQKISRESTQSMESSNLEIYIHNGQRTQSSQTSTNIPCNLHQTMHAQEGVQPGKSGLDCTPNTMVELTSLQSTPAGRPNGFYNNLFHDPSAYTEADRMIQTSAVQSESLLCQVPISHVEIPFITNDTWQDGLSSGTDVTRLSNYMGTAEWTQIGDWNHHS